MLKKILVFSIVSLCFTTNTFAYTLTNQDTKILNNAREKLEIALESDSNLGNRLINIIEKSLGKYDPQSRTHTLLTELKNITQKILEEIQQEYIESQFHTSANVNTAILRKNWLQLYNDYRSSDGLANYSYDTRLEATSQEWSQLALQRGYISHERTPGDGFYNYPIIEQWFQERGVKCSVSGRTTSVENTGYHAYYCPEGGDCTDKASQALGEIFQYYANEKGLPSPQDAHYKSIVSPYLQYLGLGLAFHDEGNGWYQVYATTHFCTEFE